MKKIKLVILLLIIMNVSCAMNYYRMRKEVDIKGKKIAVLAGFFDENTKKFAGLLTEDLQKKSKFTVISQSMIKKALKRYPVKIQGPYKSAYFDIEDNYQLSDKEKIMKIAKSINVNYVYVVWIPIDVKRNAGVHELNAIGQMFDCQTGKEIGYGKYALYWVSGMYIGWNAPKTKDESMKKTSKFVAKSIAQKMKMGNEK